MLMFARVLVFRKGVREEQGELWGISNLMKFSGESMLLELRQKYGNGLPPLVPDSKVRLNGRFEQVVTHKTLQVFEPTMHAHTLPPHCWLVAGGPTLRRFPSPLKKQRYHTHVNYCRKNRVSWYTLLLPSFDNASHCTPCCYSSCLRHTR